jgi:hypothetical protein
VRTFYILVLICLILLFSAYSNGQSPNGTISGLVLDSLGATIIGADVLVQNDATGVQYSAKSNADGIYLVSNLPPGTYRIQVSKVGFKTVIKPGIALKVEDALAVNFTLPIGALSEIVTVTAGAPLVNTESATVSTVVGHQFVENLPMNGQSFQTLIELTPGVVLTTSTNNDQGQFSVNGQRASSNYWMVDGVSANIGESPFPSGNGVGGAIGSFSVLGGTNSLVSIDAMQEFRIQTSTFAPEFGRTPGAQISIVTRSGTNQFHGTVFDYFRNDVLDANDWFADRDGLPKPEERQNDFGGTFSGPFWKDKTFFFFSYEGLRLRLPQVAETTVPDLTARQSAIPAVQPFLNAYPVPTPKTPDDAADGIGEFNSSFSNSASLDAYSLRIDHKLGDRLGFFGRYNYSPSELVLRGDGGVDALSVLSPARISIGTLTAGGTLAVSPNTSNEIRFNYSRTSARSFDSMDGFGGAVPVTSLPIPSPFSTENASFSFEPLSLSSGQLAVGENQGNVLRQINVVEDFSTQKGTHSLKFGLDFRRISTLYAPPAYSQSNLFLDVPSTVSGDLFLGDVSAFRNPQLLFHNLALFAEDTWRVTSRLTATYGLRWDVDFAPSSDPNLLAVNRFSLNSLSSLALAPLGTPPFSTPFANVAPRLGLAYQISQSPKWQLVVRGGFGVFYDLATSEVGNLLGEAGYPFSAFNLIFSTEFPLTPQQATPPAITPASLSSNVLAAFYPHLQLPYTLQWNVALEQALGRDQTVTATYVGSAGRRLLQSAFVEDPNPSFGFANLVGNLATSDYDALQLQYQRRLSQGLETLASYTWSHSIDTASAGSPFGNEANAAVPGLSPNANRGPSDFDIRNSFSLGLTYSIPTPKVGEPRRAILADWAVESVVQARSAPPVDVYDGQTAFTTLFGGFTRIRPDVVPGQPLYVEGGNCITVFGSPCPGGIGFNPNAFVPPPTDPNGDPLRQGDLPRNALRGFGATQWDFALHRNFSIREPLILQFRAEMFNLLNHPNFAPEVADINNQAQFGRSIQMLGRSLGGNNLGGGAFDPLYQIGGPRSIQLALKLIF